MLKKIKLHEPFFNGNEKKYLQDCVNSTWVSTSGKYLDLFENKIKKLTESKYAIPVLNGTIGIHVSLILSGVKKLDEVLVPSITFIGTINPIKYIGANPIFMDVDDYLNIDENKCIEFLNNHTVFKNNICVNKKTGKKISAIIIVHTFGNAAKFEKLFTICKKKKIKIIEDAAESLGTYYTKGKFKKKHTGTIGDFGVISFNGNKIVTSGNGGVILTQNKKDYAKCKYLIYQAKDDKVRFIHNEIGFNYALSNLSAAIGLAQLEKLKKYLLLKKKIHNFYKKKLSNIKNINIINGPDYSSNNYWLNLLSINKKTIRKNDINKFFLNKKIEFRPVWFPNHLQKKYINMQKYKMKKADSIYKQIICLPSSVFLEKNHLYKIISFIKKTLE